MLRATGVKASGAAKVETKVERARKANPSMVIDIRKNECGFANERKGHEERTRGESDGALLGDWGLVLMRTVGSNELLI